MLVLVLVILASFGSIGFAGTDRYKDPKAPLNRRIRDLMRRMTLEEKIGQMTQIDRVVATPDIVKKYFIGIKDICRLFFFATGTFSVIGDVNAPRGQS